MKADIDRDGCISCGLCASICSGVFRMGDDVPAEVKIERLIELQKRQKEIQLKVNGEMLGQKQKVLALGQSKKGNLYTGRNEAYQVVNFSSRRELTPGFVEVKIVGGGAYSLKGEAVC